MLTQQEFESILADESKCVEGHLVWHEDPKHSPGANEGVRVRTPFLYPDGGVIDVFVLERNGHLQVTDFGEALGWLRVQSACGQLPAKQRRMLEDVCLTLGVEFFRGQLMLRCNANTVSEGVNRVGQAVLRVTDLRFTLSQLQAT